MSKNIKTNWANQEHYNKVYSYLEKNKLNTRNTHYYTELLEKNGLRVYVTDLKDWLEAKESPLHDVELDLGL